MNDQKIVTKPVRYVPPRAKKRGCVGRILLLVGVVLGLLLLAVGGIAGTLLYNQLTHEIEQGIQTLETARNRQTFETTRIFDRHGQLLWEFFGEGKRTTIPLNQIPQDLINATISVEDDTFYENIGLDAPSLIAALVANLRNPDQRPIGGSTITQQLVRRIAFSYEEATAVSYSRKTKEIFLAYLMTQHYTKDEILELYLNEIYYGNLAYGIESASQTYFKKPAAQLTLAEASLLTGLPQSPIELDPLTNLPAAKERQWLVLNLMVREGHINQAEAEATYLQPLDFAEQTVSLVAPHFAVYVRQQLEEQYGAEMVANGGLQVTTTLDLNYQQLAEILAQQQVNELKADHNLHNAALVALKPGTGEVLAMLGSVDYQDETIDGKVNIALSRQQPGSAIKPITYAAGLSPDVVTGKSVWTLGDLLWDVPVSYPQLDGNSYRPVNYDGLFHGPVRMRQALANSYNVPAVLVLQELGMTRFLEMAQKMGIASFGTDPNRYGLAATLGGAELTPLELTSAYAVFANGGFRIPPVTILEVKKGSGEMLYQYTPPIPELVLDDRVAFLINDILDDDAARVPAMGRDNPLSLPFSAAAKTGTTNDFRDNWTVGYTPGLVVGVWMGNTDNSEMIKVTGLTGAAPLWSAFMKAVYSDYHLIETLNQNGGQPPTEFPQPEGLEKRQLCPVSSVTVGAAECDHSVSEWFLLEKAANGLPAIPTVQPTSDPTNPTVLWEQLDPAVWRLWAVGLPAEISQTSNDGLPAQLFCHFAQGVELASLPPDALPQLFLSPPRNEQSLKGAHEWAQANGVVIMPASSCTEELLATGRDPNVPAVWRILNPKAGDQINGILPIIGTADFDPSQVQFYKVEILVGDTWLTLGETHPTPITNGVLENLYADAFPPGDYSLRLVVVLWDGNYVGEPHTIPITIVP